MDMVVNSVRIIDYDQAKEYSIGDNNSLKENLAIGLLNPDDFKNLNLTSSLNLKLISNYGSVIIKPLQEKNIPLGIINMPVSIWANQITGIENHELVYKNLKVKVEVTKDSVLGIKEILNSIKET